MSSWAPPLREAPRGMADRPGRESPPQEGLVAGAEEKLQIWVIHTILERLSESHTGRVMNCTGDKDQGRLPEQGQPPACGF